MFSLSGPRDFVFLVCVIACLTSCVESVHCAFGRLRVFLSICRLCGCVLCVVFVVNCLLKAVAICLWVCLVLCLNVIVVFLVCVGFLF